MAAWLAAKLAGGWVVSLVATWAALWAVLLVVESVAMSDDP